ncbi:13042_t:CDS:2 [Acaulospora colombiana]|uniref:13042_t:CDS:1 n=1 Tax=Acaulospora colombiana TaxID=27376 RepID=A0ACA9KS10_9GLOM|nr:13042_t:CDS:2 [Acaulospora colombiana]
MNEIKFLRQENNKPIAKITGLEVENANVRTNYYKTINKVINLKAEINNKIEKLKN